MQVELSLTFSELSEAVMEWAKKHRGDMCSVGDAHSIKTYDAATHKMDAYYTPGNLSPLLSVLWEDALTKRDSGLSHPSNKDKR